MEWISAADELPPYMQLVLVWLGHQDSKQAMGLAHIAYYKGTVNSWANQAGTLTGVTHWLPLPPPPVNKHFAGIKFAADSVFSQYIPTDVAINSFSFDITAEYTSYRVFYEKDSDGYWAFKNYQTI